MSRINPTCVSNSPVKGSVAVIISPKLKKSRSRKAVDATSVGDDSDNFSWGSSKVDWNISDNTSSKLSLAKRINKTSYQAQRQEMKDRIVEEVLNCALPDVSL